MARGVNKAILIGNLGRDPEIQNFDKGVKKASFSLATTETYRNREGQEMEQTEWHNIILWRGLAEIAEKFLRKGSQVYIEGRIRNRSYEKDGQKRYITEIEGDTLNLLGSRQSNDSSSYQENQPAAQPAPPPLQEPEDDLPF
ncbi:MAG TPA: single-stranded DNA-binding protein [Lentimicrobium sp.]|jgi:single-strand DNA-binding protein|nr:single-stranded DNA-binding protein [Lentimicrobium sp.]